MKKFLRGYKSACSGPAGRHDQGGPGTGGREPGRLAGARQWGSLPGIQDARQPVHTDPGGRTGTATARFRPVRPRIRRRA